ncbi:MAG TPA: hypothetical protein VII29_09500 [Terriglobales bacterium]|jgi:hypothetical protein
MNGQEHGRAVDLISRREVEGIADTDERWLESHLAACEECASYELALSGAERAMRSFTVMASASLVESTRARVHIRAQQLAEQQARTVLIGVSFCLGVITSTLTAWVWWKFGGWVAQSLGLPSGIVEPGILLFWLLPAIVIAVLLVAFPPSAFDGSLMQRFMRERLRGMQ